MDRYLVRLFFNFSANKIRCYAHRTIVTYLLFSSIIYLGHLSRSLTKQKSKHCPILPQPVPTSSNPLTPLVTSPKNGRRTRWEWTGPWSIVDGQWSMVFKICSQLI